MKRFGFAPNEHYHVLNRGNNKQIIFLNDKDKIRFLYLILLFQSPVLIKNIKEIIDSSPYPLQHPMLQGGDDITNDIVSTRYVELECFILMPNHFHLLVHEIKEGGVARYMQRVLNAYTKYFNTRYERSGHLLQGPYKAVHIKNNNQLLYLSTYIHRNSRELLRWRGKESSYPWSSYPDFIGNNRWNKLLKHDLITGQFNNEEDYRRFTDESTAKISKHIKSELLID